jgi:DNA helicase-2/ATP-dependent DNA helicase PcrA
LAYVGMTRAMQQLVITYAETRRLYGQDKYHTISRFVREIPSDFIEEIRLRSQVTQPVYNRFSGQASHTSFVDSGYSLGQRVMHAKFGEGTVLNYEGSGEHGRVQVHFDDIGSKWLMLAYAKLEKR